MGQFASYMSRNDEMRNLDLSKLERSEASGNGSDEVAAILEQLGTDTDEAARKAIGYAMDHQDLTEFSRMARNILFRKAEESHRFKYAAAVFEDLDLVSPAWRPHMLATSTYYLQGPADRDSEAVVRARKALGMA